jgi:putative ABC transport system permease protein
MRMMNRMVVANVVHRPVRSLISVIAVALEVTMILLIVGFSVGTLNDSRQRQAGIGADVIVLPPASSAIVGMTGAPAPIKVADILAKLPHVVSVAPVLMQFSIGTGGAPEFIYGIDLKTFGSLSGGFTYLHGGPFQGPDDAIVDNVFAQSKHVKVGDSLEILNHNFRVAGIVLQGKGARKFLPMATLQEMTGAKDKASAFYLKLDNPNNAEVVVHEVKDHIGYAAVCDPFHERVPLHDDAGQYSIAVDFYQGSHWNLGCDWLLSDIPSDVRRSVGAHARNRNSQIAWGIETLHR